MTRHISLLALGAFLASAPLTSLGADQPESWFASSLPGKGKVERLITKATIGDSVVFIVRGKGADGMHQISLKVFDGSGREAMKTESRVEARDGVWSSALGYYTKQRVDAPGTWWFVFALDGQPFVSRELEVAP